MRHRALIGLYIPVIELSLAYPTALYSRKAVLSDITLSTVLQALSGQIGQPNIVLFWPDTIKTTEVHPHSSSRLGVFDLAFSPIKYTGRGLKGIKGITRQKIEASPIM